MTKLDKRTKEYKEWKKNFENKSKGLGDDVEKVFKKTGIAKVAKWALGEDCGCDERKNKLNKMFPSQKPECLTEKEYLYLKNIIGKTNQITVDQQKELILIYNRVFKDKANYTSCGTCFLNGVYKKLETILNEY
tara:strand:+ start:4451 stop:4852 length:402 start_codon:yes stop_codon:yes gene_type:complete